MDVPNCMEKQSEQSAVEVSLAVSFITRALVEHDKKTNEVVHR